MRGEIERPPFSQHVPVAIAVLLALGRVEHDAQVGQVEHSQQGQGYVGQTHQPMRGLKNIKLMENKFIGTANGVNV